MGPKKRRRISGGTREATRKNFAFGSGRKRAGKADAAAGRLASVPRPNSQWRSCNLKIGTDWKQSPPKLVWKKKVGPAWSSMIIVDGKLFTQEQHDEAKASICLDAATGEEFWSHEDKATQFWDGQAGAGPRATPTFVDGSCTLSAAREF